ncbi:MAG: 2-iminoacetate synthase ThiH, partial [Gammaproteobacteria bacterium]
MSFVTQFNQLELASLTSLAQKAGASDVEAALTGHGSRNQLADFASLISPQAAEPQYLEEMARRAHQLTVKYFGRVIRFFAPLYLSNECINICRYCGFSRDNPILRVTLTPEQVLAEARFLCAQGFRH